MKKRILRCLSGTFLVSTLTTAFETQQVFAIGGNPATPTQKEEIAEYCYEEAIKYWQVHDPISALERKFQLIKQSATPSWVSSEYRKRFKDKETPTFRDKLELDSILYEEALKSSNKEWDCRVLSGRMSKLFKLEGIKHVYIDFVPNKTLGHAAIMYAVNEQSKSDPKKDEENWYVLDMARVLDMTLTSGKYKPLKEGAFNKIWALDNNSTIKSAKDAAAIPLIIFGPSSFSTISNQ